MPRERTLVRLLGALVAVAFAACTVSHEAETSLYRTVLGTPPPQDGPLTLQRALAEANAHNERLAVEGEEYVQALIAKRREYARFLPTVTLAPTFLFRERIDGAPDLQTVDGRGGVARSSQFDLPLNATVDLFNGFGDLAALARASAGVEERRHLLLGFRESLLLDVAETYYQILRSERSLEVLLGTLAVQEEQLRESQGREGAGLARPLDVAQNEARVARTRVAIVAAENDIANGRELLALLVGSPVRQEALVDGFDPPPIPSSLDDLVVRAEAARPDLLAAGASVRGAEEVVRQAVAAYYPSLTLDFDAFLSRQSIPTERDWSGLLSANLPLFAGGRIRADVRLAWSEVRQALARQALLRRTIRREVATAKHNLGASRAKIAGLETEVAAARAAFTAAERSLEAGLSTNLERLTAQDALLNAELQLAGERFNEKIFSLALLRALGELGSSMVGRDALRTTPQ